MNESKAVDDHIDIDVQPAESENSELLEKEEREKQSLKGKIKGRPVFDKKKLKSNNDIIVSPDGGWGWMIVLGSFFIHLLTDGMLYSFGIFYFEFLNYYKGSKGETTWIGSIATGLQLLTGPFASVLTENFGYRSTAIIGTIIATVGFTLSAFSPSFHFLYFSFGIVSGLGFGLTYFPAIVSVSQYFEKKRTLAVGIASCGSGIGSFILNPLSKYFIDVYGWHGALLILGGILLHCMLCGAIFRPLTKTKTRNPIIYKIDEIRREEIEINIRNNRQKAHSSKSESDFEPNKKNNSKNGMLSRVKCFGLCTSQSKKVSFSQSKDGSIHAHPREKTSSYDMSKDVGKQLHSGEKKNKLINTILNSRYFSLFKDKIFIIYLISNVLISLSLDIPFTFLYDLVIGKGVDEESGKWLGAIIGITNTIGRVFSGILADKLKLNKMFLFSTTMVVTGISTVICPLCFNFTTFAIFSCVFGLSFGIYIPLMPVVIVDILGKAMLANAFGLLLLLKGFAYIIGPPFAGWLNDITGSYYVPFIVAGTNLTIAGVMLASAICVTKKRYDTDIQMYMK